MTDAGQSSPMPPSDGQPNDSHAQTPHTGEAGGPSHSGSLWHRPKWLLIGGVVLLVLVSAGVVLLVRSAAIIRSTQSTSSSSTATSFDPTANWQTYTNTNYRYSFKYPPSWQVSDEDDSRTVRVRGDDTFTTAVFAGYGDLEDEAAGQKQSVDLFDNTDLFDDAGLRRITPAYSEYQEIPLGNTTGYQATSSGSGKILVQNGKILYKILLPTDNSGVPERGVLEQHRQILATFSLLPRDNTRILLTQENINEHFARQGREHPGNRCLDFGDDPATQSVRYENKERGVAFAVPWNPNWGSAQFRIQPFEEFSYPVYNKGQVIRVNEGVSFGPMINWEACGWARSFGVGFEEPISAKELIAQLQIQIYDEYAKEHKDRYRDIKRETINGLDVVSYKDNDIDTLFLNFTTVVAIGDKHNYKLGKLDFGDTEEELKDIVRTMELL